MFYHLWRQNRIGNQKWKNSNVFELCYFKIERFCKKLLLEESRAAEISITVIIDLLNLRDTKSIIDLDHWVLLSIEKKCIDANKQITRFCTVETYPAHVWRLSGCRKLAG